MLGIELGVPRLSRLTDFHKFSPIGELPRHQCAKQVGNPESAVYGFTFSTVQVSHGYFLHEVLRPFGARSP